MRHWASSCTYLSKSVLTSVKWELISCRVCFEGNVKHLILSQVLERCSINDTLGDQSMLFAFALRFPLTPLSTNQGLPQIRPSPSRASPKSPFSGGAQAPAQTRLQEPSHARNGWLGTENQKEGRENSWENKKSQVWARIGLTHAGAGISGRAKPDPLLTGQEHKAQLTRCLLWFAVLARHSPSSFTFISAPLSTPHL